MSTKHEGTKVCPEYPLGVRMCISAYRMIPPGVRVFGCIHNEFLSGKGVRLNSTDRFRQGTHVCVFVFVCRNANNENTLSIGKVLFNELQSLLGPVHTKQVTAMYRLRSNIGSQHLCTSNAHATMSLSFSSFVRVNNLHGLYSMKTTRFRTTSLSLRECEQTITHVHSHKVNAPLSIPSIRSYVTCTEKNVYTETKKKKNFLNKEIDNKSGKTFLLDQSKKYHCV